jgi:tetratricopeptide (TPR) repeat protein
LRRLGVFAGGFTLEAARAVALFSSGDPLAISVLDGLESLAAQSLLQVSEVAPAPRFTMLETVREYAGERLEESGEGGTVRERHARFFLALAEESEEKLLGPEVVDWIDRLEAEHDNLRAALAWSMQNAAGVGLRLAGALGNFWALRGYYREGRAWLDQALSKAGERGLGADRALAKALSWGGMGPLTGEAITSVERSVALWRTLGDPRGLAHTLRMLAWWLHRSDPARACQVVQESIALYRQIGDQFGVCLALSCDALIAFEKRDLGRARSRCDEGLPLARRVGALLSMTYFLNGLAQSSYLEGDYRQAETLWQESLELGRGFDRSYSPIGPLIMLALVFIRQARWREARDALAECLPGLREVGRDFSFVLVAYAQLAEQHRRPRRAARLLGASQALWEADGSPAIMIWERERDSTTAAVRAQLGEEAFGSAWAEGRALAAGDGEQAVAYALEEEEG